MMTSSRRRKRDAFNGDACNGDARNVVGAVAIGALLGLMSACKEPGPRPPASLDKVQGDSQAVIVGQPVPIAPTVIVKDDQGSALADVAVTFSVGQGFGSVASSTANTTASGTATPGTWTLGVQPGDNRLVASIEGLPSVSFYALGAAAAAQMSAPSGVTFSGPPSREIRLPTFLSTATDAAVYNGAVRFAVMSGGGTLSSTFVMSDLSGAAPGRYTPGAAPGQSVINATLVGGTGSTSTLVFTLNAYAGLTFEAVSPTSISVNTGSATELVVRVRDGSAQNIGDVPVTFSVVSGGGGFGTSTSLVTKTTASGEARASWSVPLTAGTYTATAEAFGQSLTFTATASTPPYILAFGRHDQFTPAGEFAIFNLEARGISGGFIQPNVPITFSVAQAGAVLRNVVPLNNDYTYGQSIVVTSTTSDAAAQIRPVAGVNRVTVSSQGYRPDSFTVTGTRLSDCGSIANMNATDTIAANLTDSDCPGFYRAGSARWYTKPYRMTLATTTFLRISLTMPSGGPGPDLIAMDENRYAARSIANTQAGFRILVPAGTLYLGASTNTVNRTGPFTIASAALIPSPIRRGDYLMRGVDFNSSIDGAVVETSPPFRGTGGKIYLLAGAAVTIDVQSGAFDVYVAIRDVERTNSTSQEYVVLATDDNSGGGTNARLVFAAPHSGLYEVWIGTAKMSEPTGAYRLIIQ